MPIIADETDLIVAGAGRWAAAGLLDLEDVPVIRASFVSEEDRRAFALTDNRMSDLSEWGEDLLRAELEHLFEQGFDIISTGFDLADLDLGVVAADAEEEPVVPMIDAGKVVSRPGDLWSIGQHRLYCGNARESTSHEALLAGELVAMVFSDAPYNVPIQHHVSGLGRYSTGNSPRHAAKCRRRNSPHSSGPFSAIASGSRATARSTFNARTGGTCARSLMRRMASRPNSSSWSSGRRTMPAWALLQVPA